MSSGFIIAAEIGISLVVCLGLAFRELRSLKRLREAREREERARKD